MAVGFNLKYGDGYENLPGWDQFVSILNSARGRKNMFIFRVITALINELDLCGADGFQALNAIEYWASDRLSSHPRSQYKGPIIGKSDRYLMIYFREILWFWWEYSEKEPSNPWKYWNVTRCNPLERTKKYPANNWVYGDFARAGDGNRTHVTSLEGWCSTIEPHLQSAQNRNRTFLNTRERR